VREQAARRLARGCAAGTALALGAVLAFVLWRGAGVLRVEPPAAFLLGGRWDPPEHFGAAPFLLGSAAVGALALALAALPALAASLYLGRRARPAGRLALRTVLEVMLGIPSVVYGLLGLTALVPVVRQLGGGAGYGVASAGVLLAVMVLPTAVGVGADCWGAVPAAWEEASTALGATAWETFRWILLPAAARGLGGAALLALGRALGETMAVSMVVGNAPVAPAGLFTPTATLTSEIALEIGAAPYGSPWSDALYALAGVLLLGAFLITWGARRLRDAPA
jgi:phosphate transport system permease protein